MNKKKGMLSGRMRLFMIILVVMSMIITVLPGDLFSMPVSASGNKNFCTLSSSDVDNNTMDDIADYVIPLTADAAGVNLGSSFAGSNYFHAGHIYYFFISGIQITGVPAYSVTFNGVEIKDDYIYNRAAQVAAPTWRFRIWAIQINVTGTYTFAASQGALSTIWYPVNRTRNLMLNYVDKVFYDDGDDNPLRIVSWAMEKAWFYHLPDSSVINTNSFFYDYSDYTINKTITAGDIVYNNFTTNSSFFRGDLYLIIMTDSLFGVYTMPPITVTRSGMDTAAVKVLDFYTGGGYFIGVYYLTSLSGYNYTAAEDIDIMIDNTGGVYDKYIVTTRSNYFYPFLWTQYSKHMINGTYNVWINSSYVSPVRVFVHDGVNPLPNIIVQVAGQYKLTNDDGITDFFYLIKDTTYHFILCGLFNNYNSFDYTTVSSSETTIYFRFIITVDPPIVIYFNTTTIIPIGIGVGNMHLRVRYYYFLDQINVYRLDINKENTTVFSKPLYSNTGYLDYFFRSNGTYYYNITHTVSNSLHNTDNITITSSSSSFYFYPENTPFKINTAQLFCYYTNLNITNVTIGIPNPLVTDDWLYYNYPEKGVIGYDNLSFFAQNVYSCNIYDANPMKRESFAVYEMEYSANIIVTNNSDGSKNIQYKHNFIGEGNTMLRIATDMGFIDQVYTPIEISGSQTGSINLYFQGENNTYYIDIYVNNIEVAVVSIKGYGTGPPGPPTPDPVGINPLWDLSGVISSFGIDITAGYYLIGLCIVIGFALLFLQLTGNGSSALIGALLGSIICLVIGFLPLWVGVLLGVLAAAFIIFSFSGKLPAGGNGGGGSPPSSAGENGGGE